MTDQPRGSWLTTAKEWGMEGTNRVVVDTNIFVGAGFRPDSASGIIIQAIRDGRLRMIWTDATRGETCRVLERIPPLDWSAFEPLFGLADRVEGTPDEGELDWVHDESDRKFAALARAAEAVLITNDDHLLADRDRAGFRVLRSGEFAGRLAGRAGIEPPFDIQNDDASNTRPDVP